MVVIVCSVPGCEFTIGEVTEALAIALLTNHGLAHQAIAPPTASMSTPVPRGPKLERPKVDVGVTTEEWNVFVRRWEVFRAGSGINDTSAPSQLFQCAGSDLGDSLLKVNANPITDSLAQLLASMRSLAVIPVATGVLRTELLQLRQERDETFRAFAARVRGKAETCAFEATCECGNKVDYTNHVIRDVLLSGISDPDIRREALGTLDILTKAVNDVIALVEYKEMARNALPSSTLSAVSSFRRRNETLVAPTTTTPPQSDRGKQAPCPDCKHPYNLFSKGARGWNSKPHQVCIDCYRIRRRRNLPQRMSTTAVQAVAEDTISQVAALQRDGARHRQQRRRRHHRRTQPASGAISKLSPVKIDHQVFTAGEWKRARLRANPRVAITVNMDISAQAKYGDQNLSVPDTAVEVIAIADTGAQSDLWSLATFLSCGFTRDSLLPVTLSLSAANHSPIVIEGAFFAKLTAKSRSGEVSSCRSMVYVSSTVRDMYLSYDSMLSLGILANDFPSFNDTSGRGESNESSNPLCINATREINCGCDAPGTPSDESCSCPQRAAAPPRPSALPFLPTPENNERMEAWLRDRYASSTFNTCPHRALPCMEGPPVEIHVDPSAEPKACHTPANVPLHWQKRVYEDLLRDEALGVIERVPYGEPVTWCHRMVVTRKHDGSPRRTVDLSPLNKFCKRETFAMESPFHLARRIPMDTWKTVTDAWNGYHSVPLRESDRPLTTFITPFGRWRYTRAPQGFLSSGDGYNRRFDAVLSNVERKERCVDDTIHYDADLEQHWWRTIDILTRIGQAGIVLNPSKFQFAGRSVDFAGFRVSDSTIEPLPKYLDAIRDFPRPTSTTDIRSWFGLVNQVANYAQLRDVMAPFKPFLSPRCTFLWSTELEQAFQASKQAIIEAIRTGVEIFDITRRTCLRPDWSNRGIGYFLLQKHCSCLSSVPDCCPGGWRITLAGSRFLLPAEQRYAAIEGEALAVAWGLEQTKYFTQGCDDLIVITDHKPLVKIFGDRTLDEITNSRLFRLKQRTLSWRFDIEHLPGKSNSAADAASRHPSPSGLINSVLLGPVTVPDLIECALMTSIRQDAKELGTLSWPDIAQETTKDGSLGPLLLLIEQGVQEFDRSDDAIAPFWPIRESLYTQEGVLLFQDRVVIPSSLRPRVLEHLHAAHQGTSMMLQRARAIAYWPGMSNDIQKTREGCTDCNRNAPSQAATPPNPSPPPSTPFEAVFADFFDYGGNHYLVVGDRLSGWVEVFGSSAGTSLAGASGLVRHLRTFFGTFGVPEELSSDGGPEFTASLTQDFLRLWGVKHRKSSAYFPQSNGRAEVAVKTAKRLLTSNTGPTGSLDRDRFLGAMLQLRNTPDPDCNISPAQIIFGRPLRDALSFANRLEKFSNPNIRPLWRQAWAAKEDALRARMTRTTESLKEHSRTLRLLKIGERAFLQNQQGNSPTKWDRSGTIVEARGNDQYLVKVDGSGRLTLRNRRFLRAYTPATPSVQQQTTSSPLPNPTGQQHRSQPSLAVPQMHPPMPLLQEIPVTPPQSPRREVPENINPSIRNLPGPDAESTPKVDTASTPVSQDTPLRPQRPRRAHRPPMQYEPETGKWI